MFITDSKTAQALILVPIRELAIQVSEEIDSRAECFVNNAL